MSDSVKLEVDLLVVKVNSIVEWLVIDPSITPLVELVIIIVGTEGSITLTVRVSEVVLSLLSVAVYVSV